MNPKEQNMAIAKARGIQTHPRHDWDERDDRRYFVCTRCSQTIGWGNYSREKDIFKDECPGTELDFPNDLNAISDAVKHLRQTGNQFQWLDYTKELFKVVWNREATSEDCILSGLGWDVIEATSQQRAEAFLKTLGKWTPTP